jgi:hypothetical protein
MKRTIVSLASAAVLAFGPAAALAQSAAPSSMPATSMPAPSSAPASSMPSSTSMPASTSAPAETMAPTSAPVHTMAPRPSNAPSGASGTGAKPSVKTIPNGALSLPDLRYGLTHPLQEANKVRAMKKVSFDKLRVYRLSSGLKTILKVSDANADIPVLAVLGPGVEIAQTTLPGTNGSNSPIAYLQYVLANINVSNALNNVNVLNNSNVNVGVSLQDVLNGNKISIGQVAGIFVNGLGIITTITK